MATHMGPENDLLALLNHLIQLDFDAADAYRTAAQRASDPATRGSLASFQQDHERHVQDLAALVTRLGGTPPAAGDLARRLTTSQAVLGAVAGDAGLLRAMKSNEEATNTAYENAASRLDVTPEIMDVLTTNLADERRHRRWVESHIAQLEGAGPGTAAPTT